MDYGRAQFASTPDDDGDPILSSRLKSRLQSTSRLARALFGAEACHVYLIPEAADALFPGDDEIPTLCMTSDSPCAQVVRSGEPLIISDARANPLTRDLTVPGLSGPAGFYVGVPVRGVQGPPIGSLCVLDTRPRSITGEELELLEDVAATVETELRLSQTLSENLDLASQLAAARRVATIDPLTGLWNRPAIFEVIQRELGRCRRTGDTFALAMLDVDHFKRVNDTLGHQAGDQVLVSIANRLLDSTRSYDAVGRYGGEEFIILLVGCDELSARVAGHKIVEAVRARPMSTFRGELKVTASLGIAVFRGLADSRDLDRLLFDADHALLAAKSEGRDRVIMATSASSHQAFPSEH